MTHTPSILASFRQRQPGEPVWRIVAWHALHLPCFVWFMFCYRFRAWGVTRIPDTGPLLIVSNHQSYLDPIIVGLATHKRQFRALARSTLFKNPLFSGLIRLLNAIPVEQGTSDTKAMRGCVQALKDGHALLIFPEGARTLSGVTGPFETGTWLLIKRTKPTVLPVALDGAFRAWPRGKALPRLFGRIGVKIGEPMPAESLLAMGPEDGLRWLREHVESMRGEVAERLDRE